MQKFAAKLSTVIWLCIVFLVSGLFVSAAVQAAGGDNAPETPPSINWPHAGPFGTYDRASIQRGLLVYKEVCAGCHSLKYVAFRNLVDIGLTADEVKAFAREYDITDGPNDDGEMYERKGKPSDYFPSPFPNDNAARAANNGAFPPDLSLIIKARKNGENYIHALLNGYSDAPRDVKMNEGMNYNAYFAGRQIAMAAPLDVDAVEYPDGTPATVNQMSKDVVNFLAWAAEPKLEIRRSIGLKVMIFLVLFSLLMYLVKRKVWANVEH